MGIPWMAGVACALNLAALVSSLGCSGNSNAPSTYPPTITVQPSAQAVPAGTLARFTVQDWAVPGPTHTWQRSNDGGATWVPISGANLPTYSFTPHVGDNGAQFQVIVENPVGTVQSVPVGLSVAPAVYIGGDCDPGAGGNTGYWLNGSWVPLGASGSYGVYALAVSGTDVYAGAWGGNLGPGYWLNGTWVSLPPMTPGGQVGGDVFTLVVSGNDVYAGGIESPGYEGYFPGYWLNGNWVGLPLPPNWQGCEITSLVVSGSDVYAGGILINAIGTPSVGYWLDGNWIPVAMVEGQIYALAVGPGGVYAAGYSWVSPGSIPGYWLNGNWTPLALPQGASNGAVTAIVLDGTDIYMVGWADTPGWQTPGYWLNGTWVAMVLPASGNGGFLSAIAVSGGKLYAVGCLQNWQDGSIMNQLPGYWVDGAWAGLPLPASATGWANSLVVVQ